MSVHLCGLRELRGGSFLHGATRFHKIVQRECWERAIQAGIRPAVIAFPRLRPGLLSAFHRSGTSVNGLTGNADITSLGVVSDRNAALAILSLDSLTIRGLP